MPNLVFEFDFSEFKKWARRARVPPSPPILCAIPENNYLAELPAGTRSACFEALLRSAPQHDAHRAKGKAITYDPSPKFARFAPPTRYVFAALRHLPARGR